VFGLFKTARYYDEILGDLKRSGHRWRGSFLLAPHGAVQLSVWGGRSGPDSTSVALARELPEKYAILRPAIQASLFEHYEPYLEALKEGEFPEQVEPFTEIGKPDEIWPHVELAFVRIEPLRTDGE
jgi:hypothetical protein